jgi:DNA-binding HxlR family transcriptional regulator
MKNKDWYIIKDLNEFIKNTRILVFNSFGAQSQTNETTSLTIKPEETEEFDKVLGHNESEIIIKEIVRTQTNKHNHKKRYLINDVLLDKIIQQLNTRMVSNILATLVNKGLIETTYDPEVNDFVFWCEDSQT